MTRVLLHAGFHKTATKSVQDFLTRNGRLIYPRAAIVLPARIRDITRTGFWVQDLPGPAMLARLRDEYRAFLGTLNLAAAKGNPGRDLIISAENIAGRLPAGDDADGPYPAAADLIGALVGALATLPAPVEVTVYLSLRAQDDWARSLYAHTALKRHGVRVTEDQPGFAARLGRVPLADRAAAIAAALPGCRVLIRDIADLADAPFGVAQPFVDFLRLPDADLARLERPLHLHRSADPALVDRMVALNRSDLDAAGLAAAKQGLMDGSGMAGTDMRGKPR